MREITAEEVTNTLNQTYPEWVKLTLLKKCAVCGKNSVVGFDYEESELYYDWVNGRKTIQNVFPDVKPEIREMLISGTHPECWTIMNPETTDAVADHVSEPYMRNKVAGLETELRNAKAKSRHLRIKVVQLREQNTAMLDENQALRRQLNEITREKGAEER